MQAEPEIGEQKSSLSTLISAKSSALAVAPVPGAWQKRWQAEKPMRQRWPFRPTRNLRVTPELLRYARGALHEPHARVPTTQASGIFQFIDGLRGEALGGSLTRSDQRIRSMQIEIKIDNAQWAGLIV